jgi:hypothetical protein
MRRGRCSRYPSLLSLAVVQSSQCRLKRSVHFNRHTAFQQTLTICHVLCISVGRCSICSPLLLSSALSPSLYHWFLPGKSSLLLSSLLSSDYFLNSDWISGRCLNWCSKHGICTDPGEAGYCICETGYTGADCAKRMFLHFSLSLSLSLLSLSHLF